MKKLLAIAAMATTLASSAAMVDWSYVGAESDTGSSIYLFVGDSAPTTFESLDALKAASINTGKTVVDVYNARSKTHTYNGSGSAENDWSAGDKFYYVLVSSDNQTFYVDPSAATVAAANIYNKGEGAGATLGTTTSSTSHSYASFGGGSSGGGDVPEPTSGLLLLVGGAMLALRRRQK